MSIEQSISRNWRQLAVILLVLLTIALELAWVLRTQPAPTDTSLPPVYSMGEQSANPPNLTHIDMLDANTGSGLSQDGDQSDTYLPHNIVRTTDGGSTWTKATPTGATSNTVMLAVHFLDTNTGWVATTDQQQPQGMPMAVALYRTRDGGQTWSSTTVPFSYSFVTPYPLVSLDFLDANRGWMTIYGPARMSTTPGQLFSTTDGGATWTQTATTAGGGLGAGQIPFGGSIYFHDASTGWLVGSMADNSAQHLYITHDGGLDWQEQVLAVADAVQSPSRIHIPSVPVFFSDTQGVIIAVLIHDNQQLPTSAVVFATSDAGKSWTGATSVPASYSAPFAFFDNQHWWIWTSGPHWTDLMAPVQGILYRTANGNQVWNVPAGSGQFSNVTWGQLSSNVPWTQLSPGSGDALAIALNSDFDITQLHFASTNVGWALLEALANPSITNPAARPNILLKTTDGGQTWTK